MGHEMGNNNTSSLREEESSKLEDNGRSLSQDHVFLADKGKDRDNEKETDSLINCHEQKEDESPETNLQTEESEEEDDEKNSSKELKLSENCPQNLSATVDRQLEMHRSVAVAEGEHESAASETENIKIGLIPTESGEATSGCVVDDVYVSRSFHESASSEENEEKTVKEERESPEENLLEEDKFDVREELSAETENGIEEKLCVDNVYGSRSFLHESVFSDETDDKTVKETLLCEDSVTEDENKFNVEKESTVDEADLLEVCEMQKSGKEGFSEIRNLENNQKMKINVEDDSYLDDADEEKQETIDEFIKQEIKPTHDQRSSVKIAHNRSQSLPVRFTKRILTDSLAQQTEKYCLGESSPSEGACFSSNKMRLKGREPENVFEDDMSVPCVRSNEAQEANGESTIEADPQTRSPSFGSDLRIEARTEELSDETPLLHQDKAETYEEKTVMLEKDNSEKSRTEFRGFLKEKEEMGIEDIMIKPKQEEKKKTETIEETEGFGDNLCNKKTSSGSMQGKERRRSRGSIFGTCLCCAAV